MAVWTNKNSTYYINPAYLTFVENSGYGANLIQVSASSSCYISVYDPSNGINYSDADNNYRRWKITAYNNKFPSNAMFYIYVRLEKDGTSALIIYDTVLRGVKGGKITITTDENGNEVRVEEEVDEKDIVYYYILIGEVSATDGTSIREIHYDTGMLTSDRGRDTSSLSEMWRLDKYTTPHLIEALHDLKGFVVRGFVKLIGGFIFSKGKEGDEKKVVDIKRSVDDEPEYMVDENGVFIKDENGNLVPNPEHVPISDETIPTTKWVSELSEGRYIRKDQPDETDYRVKFRDGIETGHFDQGPLAALGKRGARIDGDGYGEMTGLTLREFLEVPELRFNRIDVVSGILWNSVAFGLIEYVDTKSRICRLKLEAGERSGLHVMDICMGIFSDFGDGTVKEEYDTETGELKDPGHDANGLPRMYGFSTSYFTPTTIIKNEAGVFEFQYRLQEGTTRHPCESMKFAVYGNFVDATRQASAYSTRTYKRYLNKVDNWVIDPDKNIYAQYGDIEGLTIGGYTMHGYGSYQSNVYLTGSVFEFTPQQKEELKGEDAYSATLSDYEGIVVIDDEGNIIGGEQMLMNVITEGQNVITQKKNVITSAYKLSTQVHASRGSTVLHHALTPEEDGFTVALNAVGCTAAVINGVVVVTSVIEPKNCKVNITVNCEGKTQFTLAYHITAVTDGKNPVIADLDNEMEAVACAPDGTVLFGLPVSTTVSMWAGTKALRIDRVNVSAPVGVTIEQKYIDQEGRDMDTLPEEELTSVISVRCVVSIPEGGITKEAERTLPVKMTAYASYGGMQYHKDLTFTVNKVIAGENAVIYKLRPSLGNIVLDSEGELSSSTVNCAVLSYDGKTMVELTELPNGLSMTYDKVGNDDTPPAQYILGTPVNVVKADKKVIFNLYRDGKLEDSETIHVLRDGVGSFKSTVFIRTNDTPDQPKGGSYSDPIPDDKDSGGKRIWSDGIPAGEEILWASSCTFLSNGTYPADAVWSNPRQMTDTASFEAIYSEQEKEPVPPTVYPTTPGAWTPPSPWTDDPSTNSVWMATAVKHNGQWTDWVVSKIKGEKGEDAVSTFKSFVFLRQASAPAAPTGGSYESPFPTSNSNWKDGVPAGEAILWMTSYTFASDVDYTKTVAQWSTPCQMTDTASFEAIYSEQEKEPAPPAVYPTTPGAWTPPSPWTDDPSTNSVWMATAVKHNEQWTDWVVSKIKGEKGEDGTDALQLVASTSTVARNSFGSYVPDTIRVRALRGGVEELANITVYGVKQDHTVGIVSGCQERSVVEIKLSALEHKDYTRLVFRAYKGMSNDYYDGSSIAETSVSFVGDGSSGPMPRNCGEYSSTKTYYYNNEYRDFVWMTTSGGTKVYMRDGFGSDGYPQQDKNGGVIGITPSGTTDYWAEVPRTIMTAIDTALVDTANIAGFMFRNGMMVSQEQGETGTINNPLGSKIILDGSTGYFKCVDADVDGDLTAGSMKLKTFFSYEGGNLSGYSMGVGFGTFVLPKLSSSVNVELRMYSPVYSKSDAVYGGMYAKPASGDYFLVIDQNGEYMTTSPDAIRLSDNKLYTLIGLGSEGCWFISGSSFLTGTIAVDSALSTTSDNPVQNKVITAKINELEGKMGSQIVRPVDGVLPDDPDPNTLYIL